MSGPLLDRLDLAIDVPAVSPDALVGDSPDGAAAQRSSQIRERVAGAHARQLRRQGKVNARLAVGEVAEQCRATAEAQALVVRAMASLSLSARAYHRILKVARTIADLADADVIASAHVAEAIQYRRFSGAHASPSPGRIAQASPAS